jgi:transcriptional regulator with XRE-family HTH domain
MGKGRGGGKTPKRVMELLAKSVVESSQVAVANATGLTRLTVQRYLKGVGEPSQETLQKLADYFRVSVAYLRGTNSLSELFTQLVEEESRKDPSIVFENLTGFAAACIEEGQKDHPDNIALLKDACRIAADCVLLAASDLVASLPKDAQDDAPPAIKALRDRLDNLDPKPPAIETKNTGLH